MIKIRQHGADNKLYDIMQFLEDIDQYFKVEMWQVQVDWCQGEDALKIEKETKDKKEYSDKEFRKMYAGIFQTIDGYFKLLAKNEVLAKIIAVDSSFWEIESKNKKFLKHMLKKYGEYKYNA